MTDEELFDALDGLHAYDSGNIGSGIHDESLRHRVIAELHADAESVKYRLVGPRLQAFVEQYYYRAPYTFEDVVDFARWLSEEMDFEVV